jgi:hypothetical protein
MFPPQLRQPPTRSILAQQFVRQNKTDTPEKLLIPILYFILRPNVAGTGDEN